MTINYTTLRANAQNERDNIVTHTGHTLCARSLINLARLRDGGRVRVFVSHLSTFSCATG